MSKKFLKLHEKFYQKPYQKITKTTKYTLLHLKRFIKLIIKTDPENIADKTIKLGLKIVAIFLAIFIIWGVIAPSTLHPLPLGK
jgi:hypothetical protein